jgi:hypothetical protein
MDKSKRIWPSDKGDIVTIEHIVHEFSLSDVDDPDILAAEPIWNWQQSDSGKWVMENAIQQPSWHRHTDIYTYGYRYQIRAGLTAEQITFFELKYK